MRPDDTAPDGAVLIPLRARDGSILAHAVVDAADAEWVNQWRWHLHSRGYAVRSVAVNGNPRQIFLHRELLGLPRVRDGREVDHVDRDKLNNRRSNLRVVTHAQNVQNFPSHRGSTSGHRGVHWSSRKRKWVAKVRVNREQIFLGHFESEMDAAVAARDARARLLPFSID